MLNYLNKFISFSDENNLLPGEDRNKLVSLICDRVASSSLSQNKLKTIFSEYIPSCKADYKKNEVIEKLKIMLELFEEIGLSEDIVNKNKELIIKNVLRHGFGKKLTNKEKIKDRVLKGLRDISFTKNIPELYEAVLTHATDPSIVGNKQELFELINKVRTLNKSSGGRDENLPAWSKIIINIPLRKNIISNEEELLKYINFFSYIVMDSEFITDVYRQTMLNAKKESSDWEELKQNFVNELFKPGQHYTENKAILLKILIANVFNQDDSTVNIYIKKHNKNLSEFLSYVCETPGMMTMAALENYKELLNICIINRDRESLLSTMLLEPVKKAGVNKNKRL